MPCLIPAEVPSNAIAEAMERNGVTASDLQFNNRTISSILHSVGAKHRVIDDEEEEDDDDYEEDHMGIIRSPMASNSRMHNQTSEFLIPPKDYSDNRLTVVLDLDETLISNHSQNHFCADNSIVQRPHLQSFLSSLASCCEVILWTASTYEITEQVLRSIDPCQTIFDHVISRSPKWFKGVPYTKDLKLLGRCMDRVMIVENNSDCVVKNPNNAILVSDFHGIPQPTPDLTLLVVQEIIEEIILSDEPVHGVITSCQTLCHRHISRDEMFHEVPKCCKPLRM
eukprot:TRINITY_DN1570_c3_g1_i2.p1 TRINITY_DN1570_c3_g1~~TRINITY_DN1570_c3_g1_i2.p1  ORF type:complete len:282 (+),score=24.76 TRINITY_DN1570_c3_g1_i2:99-944(+)